VTGGLIRALAAAVPFEEWQRHGYHLTPNHFYSPIPDTTTLPEATWEHSSELVGIDMREAEQVALLQALTEKYGTELDTLPLDESSPGTFFLHNRNFESLDAKLYYALIRHFRPARIMEIGSGWSSMLALQALEANTREGSSGTLVAYDPFPRDFLLDAARDAQRFELVASPVQDVPVRQFTELGENDVLFIDSTHVCRTGSDVAYELLEILPRLPVGVLVHLHDIFLPYDYPREWVVEQHQFWNEQYVLQAFLCLNHHFEVVWGSSYMIRRHGDLLASSVRPFEPHRGNGSFWLRRVSPR
jgi:hypothetical protein